MTNEFTYEWLREEQRQEITMLRSEMIKMQDKYRQLEQSKMLLLSACHGNGYTYCDKETGLLFAWQGYCSSTVEIYKIETGSYIRSHSIDIELPIYPQVESIIQDYRYQDQPVKDQIDLDQYANDSGENDA